MPFRLTPNKGSKPGVWAMLCLLMASIASVVLASDSPVPLYPAEQALALARNPIARMVDGAMCERVGVVRYRDTRGNWKPVPGANVALFRGNSRRRAFMHVMTREDGVYIARFSAVPNEPTYGRAFVIDPQTGEERYGNELRAVCVAGNVEVGELLPAPEGAENEGDRQQDVP